MRKKEHARGAIVREWRALPADQRKTDAQAVAFAAHALQRYPFRAKGDAYRYIMSWLGPYIGRP
jgi:hypothetical protein